MLGYITPPTKPKYYMPYRVVAASDASDESKKKAHYVCDGTNDEAEIEQAINDLPSSGGIVFLTEGTFNFTDTYKIINLNKPFIAVIGSGAYNTVIYDDAKTYAGFSIDEQCKYIVFKDFSYNGYDLGRGGLIYDIDTNVSLGSKILIENMKIYNVKSLLNNPSNNSNENIHVIISKCNFQDVQAVIVRPTGIRISFDKCYFNLGNYHLFYFNGGSKVLFKDCIFTNTKFAFSTSTVGDVSQGLVEFINCKGLPNFTNKVVKVLIDRCFVTSEVPDDTILGSIL